MLYPVPRGHRCDPSIACHASMTVQKGERERERGYPRVKIDGGSFSVLFAHTVHGLMGCGKDVHKCGSIRNIIFTVGMMI